MTHTVPSCFQETWIADTFYDGPSVGSNRAYQYGAKHVGLPEWASRRYGPYQQFFHSDSAWHTASYRSINIIGMAGTSLAIHLYRIRAEWDRQALLDYFDRWYFTSEYNNGLSGISPFVLNMWNTYRANYGPIWSDKRPRAAATAESPVVDTVDAAGLGSELVELNGSGSTDPDNDVAQYLWFEDGEQIASGEIVHPPLSVGSHTITLRVIDAEGHEDTATVTVAVQAPPVAKPALKYPGQAFAANDLTGSVTVDLNGSQSTDPDGTIVSYVWSEDGSPVATGPAPPPSLWLRACTPSC